MKERLSIVVAALVSLSVAAALLVSLEVDRSAGVDVYVPLDPPHHPSDEVRPMHYEESLTSALGTSQDRVVSALGASKDGVVVVEHDDGVFERAEHRATPPPGSVFLRADRTLPSAYPVGDPERNTLALLRITPAGEAYLIAVTGDDRVPRGALSRRW